MGDKPKDIDDLASSDHSSALAQSQRSENNENNR